MDKDSNPWEDTFKKAEDEYAQTVAAMEAKERIFNSVMKTIATDPTSEISYDVSVEYVRQLAEENQAIDGQPAAIAVKTATRQPSSTKATTTGNRRRAIPLDAQKRKSQPRQKPATKAAQGQKVVNSTTNKRFAKLPRILAGFGAAAAALLVITTGLLGRDPKPQVTNYESFDPQVVQTVVLELPEEVRENYKTLAANKYLQLGYLDDKSKEDVIQLVINSYSGEVNWDSFYATNKNNDLIVPISIDKENKIVTIAPSESEIQVEIKDKDGNLLECIISQDLSKPA